jgi:hypothetical protein
LIYVNEASDANNISNARAVILPAPVFALDQGFPFMM